MKRKQFLLTTMSSVPAFAFAKTPGDTNSTKEPFIVRSGNNRSGEPMMKFMGVHQNDVVISRKDTNNTMGVFLFAGYAGAGTPMHLHFKQDEFFYVIEGKYLFVCGNLREELNAGDTIFLPRNMPHQWLQLSDDGKLLYAVQPAGTLEDMFQELNEKKGAPTDEQLSKILSKHGQKLLGPPMKLGFNSIK